MSTIITEWRNHVDLTNDLNLQEFAGITFNKITGYSDWLVLSNSNYELNRGLIVVTNTALSQVFHIIGDSENYFGRNIWISGDGWFDSILSEDGKDHPIIGMSYRTSEDESDHVTFFKLIRDTNETYHIF